MVSSTLSALLFRWWYFTASGGGKSSSAEFIFLTIGIIILLMALYYTLTRVLERRSLPVKKTVKLTESLSTVHKSILSERFDYYNKLSVSDKELFEKKVRHYMLSKMFTSEDGYAVTEEMKVMISASASQITFGLTDTANTNFTHILIMPNASMTPRSASRNTIVVPWREFVEGYKHSDDGQNEGLKVMASAVVKDNRLQDKAFKLFPAKKYENWEKVSLQEAGNFMSGMFENMAQDDRVRDEYFAMAVVYFFELPIAFKQKYTALYDAMSLLLGQDTAKKMGRK